MAKPKAKSRNAKTGREAIVRKRGQRRLTIQKRAQPGVAERIESSYDLPNETIRRLQNLLLKRKQIPGGRVRKAGFIRRYAHIEQPSQGLHFDGLRPGLVIWVMNNKGGKIENYLGVVGKGHDYVAAFYRKVPGGEWVKTEPKTFGIDEFSPVDNLGEQFAASNLGLYAWAAGIKVGPRWLGRLV